MILETIIGVSSIYLLAKAQKPKLKSIVPSKVSLDAIEVMPLDQTIFYETVVYAILGRSIDPIIAGRVVSKAEYMAAKNLN